VTLYVYVMGAPDGCVMKVGWSANPDRRLSDLRKRHSKLGLQLLLVHQSANAKGLEAAAHRLLRSRKLRGEYFLASPAEAKAAVRRAFLEMNMPFGIAKETRPIAEAHFARRYAEATVDGAAS
jgi:hypothetical protein